MVVTALSSASDLAAADRLECAQLTTLMDDPRRCDVNVAALSGLSPAQQTALKAIYAPTRSGSTTIFGAQPVGGEGEAVGWPLWITGMPPRKRLIWHGWADPALSALDTIKYFDAWVESGKAPDRIYKGTGSTDEAENFECREPTKTSSSRDF
jgi:hypothetical protein